MNHSPEPWKLEHRSREPRDVHVIDASGDCLIDTDWIPGTDERADYRRIVACVNALKGVPTEILERVEHTRFGGPDMLTGLHFVILITGAPEPCPTSPS